MAQISALIQKSWGPWGLAQISAPPPRVDKWPWLAHSQGGVMPTLSLPRMRLSWAPCTNNGTSVVDLGSVLHIPPVVAQTTLQPLQAVSTQPTPGFSPGLFAEAWVSHCFKLPFSWLSIHSVAVNFQLFSRAMKMLIFKIFAYIFTLSVERWPQELTTPPIPLMPSSFISFYFSIDSIYLLTWLICFCILSTFPITVINILIIVILNYLLVVSASRHIQVFFWLLLHLFRLFIFLALAMLCTFLLKASHDALGNEEGSRVLMWVILLIWLGVFLFLLYAITTGARGLKFP